MAGNHTNGFLQFFRGEKIGAHRGMDTGNTLEPAHHFVQLQGVPRGIEKRVPGNLPIVRIKENHEGRGTEIFAVFGRWRGSQHAYDKRLIQGGARHLLAPPHESWPSQGPGQPFPYSSRAPITFGWFRDQKENMGEASSVNCI